MQAATLRSRASTRAIVATIVAIVAIAALVVTVAATSDPQPRADLVAVAPVQTEPASEPETSTSSTAPALDLITDTPPDVLEASPPTGTGPVEPARLRIPAIGVDAPIVDVGLEPDGSMEVPAVDQAGWYHPTGIWPGSPTGSAVVAAHVDYGGRRGVFFDLRRLPEGAEVWVSDGQGRERRFVVHTRFQMDKDDLAAHDLFRVDGAPTLTLITCGGAFDAAARSYRDNIVVQASPA